MRVIIAEVLAEQTCWTGEVDHAEPASFSPAVIITSASEHLTPLGPRIRDHRNEDAEVGLVNRVGCDFWYGESSLKVLEMHDPVHDDTHILKFIAG